MIVNLWNKIKGWCSAPKRHYQYDSGSMIEQNNDDRLSSHMISRTKPKNSKFKLVNIAQDAINQQATEKQMNLPLKKYTLKFSPIEQNNQQNQKQQLYDSVIQEMLDWDRSLKEVEMQFQNLKIGKDKLQQDLKKRVSLQKQTEKILTFDQTIDPKIMKIYKKRVQVVTKTKYSKEKIDYPHIPAKRFQTIYQIWSSSKDNQVFKQRKHIEMDLTYHNLKTLNWGAWLNDEVINSYLNMINQKLVQQRKQNQNCKLYLILSSLLVTTTFSKAPDAILKTLNRKKITKDHILILPIHHYNHWFFCKMEDFRLQIFDSFRKKSDDDYLKISVISKLLNFSQWFYGKRYQLEVVQTFPSQQNGYDCGIFMTFGIKDIVRDKELWTFEQKDCGYKRVQMANELINQEITGF